MQNVGAFRVGDFIKVTFPKPQRAQIIRFRDEIGNHRTGEMSLGADLLLEDGKISFHFMKWIVDANPDTVAATFKRGNGAGTMLCRLLDPHGVTVDLISGTVEEITEAVARFIAAQAGDGLAGSIEFTGIGVGDKP